MRPIDREVRGRGQRLLQHGAPLGRRHHRPAGHARRARARHQRLAQRADPADAVRRVPHVDMSATRYVEHTRRGPVETVTLRRPEVHNAFNEQVIAELADGVRADPADRTGRASSCSRAKGRRSAPAPTSTGCAAPPVHRRREPARRRRAGRDAARGRRVPVPGRRAACRAARSAAARAWRRRRTSRSRASRRASRSREVRLGLVPATIARHVDPKDRRRPRPAAVPDRRAHRCGARALAIGLVHTRRAGRRARRRGGRDGRGAAAGGPEAQRRVQGAGAPRRRRRRRTSTRTPRRSSREVRTGDEGREGVAAFLEKRRARWAAERDV